MYMEDDRDGDDAIRDLEGVAAASVPCPLTDAARAPPFVPPSTVPCSSDPVRGQRAIVSESGSPANN